jgi:hypothetical protein
MKKLVVGDIVTKTKLHKLYWYGAAYELVRCGYAEDLTYADDAPERKKGEVKKYRVLKELPDNEAFRTEVTEKFFTADVEDWVQQALEEIESIKDEMVDWRDNLESCEGLSQTSKADEVREAADALEYIDIPRDLEDIPDFLQEQDDDDGNVTRPAFKVTLTPMLSTVFSWRSRRNITGRTARLQDSGAMLNMCAEAIREETLEEKCPWTPEQQEEATELANSMEEIASEIEGIDCPGMF